MRRLPALLLIVLAVPLSVGAQDHPTTNPDAASYQMPPAAIAEALQTDKNYVVLDNPNPSGTHFLVVHETELSTLELMSRPTYRLGELQLRPGTNRLWTLDTYGNDGLSFFSLADRSIREVPLPDATFLSEFVWSPDGSQVAFLSHLPNQTEVWVADAASGAARARTNHRVLATVAAGDMLQWGPDGSLYTLIVPLDRGPEPQARRIPSSPTVRKTRDRPTSSRTYPYLLENAHDEALFEYYTRSQLVRMDPRGRIHTIGEPQMWEEIALSPDGNHILATRIERPFSFRTSYRGFPRRTVIVDAASGDEVELEYSPLREGGFGGGGANDGPRSFSWGPTGPELFFLERGEKDAEGERPDHLKRTGAPFDLEAAEIVATSPDAIRSATFTRDLGRVFATVSRDGDSGIAFWDVGAPNDQRTLLGFSDIDDPTKLPGSLLTRRTPNGIPYVVSDGSAAFLEGPGYRADFRPQPFIDRVGLADTVRTRIFEGSVDSYDRPLAVMSDDASRLVVQRESQTDFPDSFLWEAGTWTQLTRNVDPFPAVTAASRMDFEFERRDGLTVQGRVSLPVGYEPGTKVPAIFWTYPREYTTQEGYEHAAIRSRNQNEFTHMSWLRWSNLWLLEGYALVYPDIPIVGENYNDTYIGSLVDAMYGAIRAVDQLDVIDIDRLAHGGHSYGAFATANILANTPYFRAGIAGDGAYNRSLTPSGFQAERRTVWEAPHTYIEMSPFFRADQIDTPILLYHGADDNNTGTFPVQSRRMIHALTELGKTAVLYEYPFESHTPRAIENKLDMWARFIDWLDTYVRAPVSEAATAEEGG